MRNIARKARCVVRVKILKRLSRVRTSASQASRLSEFYFVLSRGNNTDCIRVALGELEFTLKQTGQYSIRGFPQIYDRKSYPEFFEMWEKVAGASAFISPVAGLAILVAQLI